ncbi:MAG: FprA family A-type flavoprotein [Firmicutes bacterium]|nr:FprA family A-type flavoprotein [Bacillota bacterium]
MKPIEMKPGIYWVGGIDWDLRNFHGYLTQLGSTYNAYLIVDEKITVVDTVKHYLFDEMMARIKQIVDPEKIDYIISNHVEMDHSGSLLKLKEAAPNAEIISSPFGKRGLLSHFDIKDEIRTVKEGDRISIGKRTLSFHPISMVHWPDSMMTYCPEEKLLLPNDAFGQHIASNERFVDELGFEPVYTEAAKYYANIVFPFGQQVRKALEIASKLETNMIGPSHGLIWRGEDICRIVQAYAKWANYESENKAVIVYDTMWESTHKMAYALMEGFEEAGLKVVIRNLQTNHISDIITDILTARAVCLGSPTLNCTILPTMGGFLSYLKGLSPQKKIGFAFGSYGWGGQGAKELHQFVKDMNWETPFEPVNVQYIPKPEHLAQMKQTGMKLAEIIVEQNAAKAAV